MKPRDSLAPLCIRLALAAFFIWTGSAKLFYTNEYSGAAAAVLANMGIVTPEGDAAPPAEATPPVERENLVPPSRPAETSENQARAASPAVLNVQSTERTWTPEDFDEPVTARRIHTVTLMIKSAAEKGRWPGFLSGDSAIEITAWVICSAELVGGILMLAGFFTRLASIVLIGAAAGALVFTTILPATSGGSAFLGFLPPHELSNPNTWVDAWSPWQLRFFALMGGLSILMTGAGRLSLDALFFPGESRGSADADADPDDDD